MDSWLTQIVSNGTNYVPAGTIEYQVELCLSVRDAIPHADRHYACRRVMEVGEWKEKNAKARRYAHFDDKVSLDRVWSYISNPNNIATHGFYPFIHYQKEQNKFKQGEIVPKSRKICYSAHVDRYIYSYYGFKLNQFYNDYVLKKRLDEIAVAYRDNLKKSNIHFAKKAIDRIRNLGNCFIIIGDFTDFFDSLDHGYLKQMLLKLLDMDYLPNDYYAVYKNITRYSMWDLENLLELNQLPNNEKGIKEFNCKDKAIELDDFKKIKKGNPDILKINKSGFGVPQGSAISAVLSNIYMLDFDEELTTLVRSHNGMYMRYSDDFIVILPKKNEDIFKAQYIEIVNIISKVPRLKLQQQKTQVFSYEKMELKSCNSLVLCDVPNGKNFINYLGFTFDGKEVTIREKTVAKYYYRMYRKLKTIIKHKGVTSTGKRINCKNIYEKYSIKGAGGNSDELFSKKGNFISYVQRAGRIFGEPESINRKTKRHMLKIRRRLDKAFKA